MNITAMFKTRSLGACGVGLSLLIAQPCAAQKAACVNLLVGAGYATWMGVEVGNSRYWSESYPIGQYRCVKLPVPGMVDGMKYNVIIFPVGGHTFYCTPRPSPYNSKDQNSVTYNAWGTTLAATCELPFTEERLSSAPTDITPSKEGIDALEKWKKEGPKPAPQ